MNKIGLVFAGGGGKGAYQIGVWKALKEFGVDQNIKAIAGTSVGALNAVLFLQEDYEKAEAVWLNISPEKILTIDPEKIASKLIKDWLFKRMPDAINWLAGHGWFSRSGLLEIIRNEVNLTLLRKSKIPCFATCYNAETKSAEYFQLNLYNSEKIESILLASSAIPVAFDSVEIDAVNYWDGGLVDNVPVNPLYHEGCDLIIAVHLSRESVINHNDFPKAQIIEIVPQEQQGGFINGTLDFSPTSAKRRMLQGYQDTKKIFQPIFDMMIVQRKMQKRLAEIKQSENEFRKQREVLVDARDQLKQELNLYLNK
ncbi:patatin-like phospholipase family protein [Priestia flexa]|uniref:patatin-like phospholipase family protein n=1 Tax=Priestia flexa TaxID=86664 RepID=UPI003CFEA0D3